MSAIDPMRALMTAALEGVTLEGRILAAGVCDGVAEALTGTGAAVTRWTRHGLAGTPQPPAGSFDRVALRLPRGRRNLEATLHVACAGLAPEGRLWLYGANDEGIRSSERTLRALFERVETVDARKHGRVILAEGRGPTRPLEDFYSPVEAEVAGRKIAFWTLPGVFAEGRLDEGTRHLLEHLTVTPGSKVLDVGCGAGAIGLFLGPEVRWTGVDVDTWALACAARVLPPSQVRLADVLPAGGESYDAIVSNPPFHDGDALDFRVLDALIAGAPKRLTKGGRLTMVCPVTAGVRPKLEAVFKTVKLLSDNRRTRVWEAS